MKEDNNKNNKYVRYGVLIFLWLLLIGGLSYAYFTMNINNDDKTSTKVTTGRLDINFTEGEYINNESMWPINDEDVFSSGDKSNFSVGWSNNNTVEKVYYNIYLDNIIISDNFKSDYIKWILLRDNDPQNVIGTGSFVNASNDSLIQLNTYPIRLFENEIHDYSLYLWISDSGQNNQNSLLEGSLSARVRIDAVTQ